jgi:hypothetical protein
MAAQGSGEQWHLRAPNPSNPVVFFGESCSSHLCELSCHSPSLTPPCLPPPPPPTCNTTIIKTPRHGFMRCADVTIGGAPAGRIKMELFADICPKTCENFRQFCTGEFKQVLFDAMEAPALHSIWPRHTWIHINAHVYIQISLQEKRTPGRLQELRFPQSMLLTLQCFCPPAW